MSLFLDTGVVVAAHNVRDANHVRALAIVREVRDGDHGTAFSSDFVLDEAVTLALVRTRNRATALDVGRFFLPDRPGQGFVALLHVDEATVRRAWESFRHRDTPSASRTGRSWSRCGASGSTGSRASTRRWTRGSSASRRPPVPAARAL